MPQAQDDLMSFGQRLSLAQRNVEAAQVNLDSAVEFMNQLVRDFTRSPQSIIPIQQAPQRMPVEYVNGHMNGNGNGLKRPYNKNGKKVGRPRKDALALPPAPSELPPGIVKLKKINGKDRIKGMFAYPWIIREFVARTKPGEKAFSNRDIIEFAKRLGYIVDKVKMSQAISHQAGTVGPRTLVGHGQGDGYSVNPDGDFAELAGGGAIG